MKRRLNQARTALAAGLVFALAGGAFAQSMSEVEKTAKERGLSTADLLAAAKTYTPSGMKDEYVIFSSGGHSGQVFVIGVPSMRLLRSIAVFTPEPWQGWGYGVGNEVLAEGNVKGKENRWGDTHHPALSETAGDYDGDWLFINDKANARIAVIDLRDFETKQIVKNPLFINDHGGAFVDPNTNYIFESAQYNVPWGEEYAPMSDYKKSFRGAVTMWKFDRKKGRIDKDKSFAIELPPYWHDIADAGKLESDGLFFLNSINTELATGGIEQKKPPFEAGVSMNATDYLHIIDWKKAEKVYQAGQTKEVEGFPVIPLDVAIKEGIVHVTPEPRSPHGVDVAPKGDFVVVSGKLDPHTTIYSVAKIKEAIANKDFSGTDEFGIPVLNFDSVMEAQVEVGLGPLHTQFGPDGYAYTSLFLDSAIARWTLGGAYSDLNPEPDWTLVQKTPVNYNVGHLGAAEGDTVDPDGKYLISYNKWSVDRFLQTGPLLPQNFQLLDISKQGTEMPVIYDMPIGVGEPHYAQIIKADKLHAWAVYPEVGWDPTTQAVDPWAPRPKMERVERKGDHEVEVYMTAVRSHFSPEHVTVREGDKVTWRITNTERAIDATHGFSIPLYNITLSLEPGETATFEFTADTAGTYPFYCTEFCSALHLEMMGYLMVEPNE